MSKEITARLLKLKVDSLKNEKRGKDFLIECIKSHGLIKEEPKDDTISIPTIDTCQICKSNNFIFTSNEKICKECGLATDSSVGNFNRTYKMDLNTARGTFIEPGTNVVTINKDGKTVTRDLSKLNTWLSSDPEEQKIKLNLNLLNEALDKIKISYNPIVFERIESVITSMWYNIITIKPVMKMKEKLALLAWCIYYPIAYNDLNINIQKIATILDTTTANIYSYNFVLKEIFNKTDYEKYISVPIGVASDIQISPELQRKYNIIKRDLKDYLGNPIRDKEHYAIIYFASQLTNEKMTLSFLAEKSGISQTTIGQEVNKINRFYEKNPTLKSRINIK